MKALYIFLWLTMLGASAPHVVAAVDPPADKFAVEIEPDKGNGNKMHLAIHHAPQEVKIVVTDASGKEFHKEKLKAAASSLTQVISLEHLKPGIYYITVVSGQELYRQSYAVEH